MLLWFGKNRPSKKAMDKLNEMGARIYGQAYEEYSEMAKSEGEDVFRIFHDWWYGESVTTEEYKSQFSEEDYNKASNVIMTAISSGFG